MLKITKKVIFVEKSFAIPDKLSRFSRYMNYVSTNYRFFLQFYWFHMKEYELQMK